MKLHIFNPEHDIALASSIASFTPPHAARKMRADLGYIAALWADDGDFVLVDDKEYALEAMRCLNKYVSNVIFITESDLIDLDPLCYPQFSVHPWGWNATIKRQLLNSNPGFSQYLPDDELINRIKEISNRRFASEFLLSKLRLIDKSLVGEGIWISDIYSLNDVLTTNSRSVLKAPWSGSGRGLRYVDEIMDKHLTGWCRNIIKKQGGLMVEPFYNKIVDFGMEFDSDGSGNVAYCGLSLFSTVHGAYTGSVLASETYKQGVLGKYIDSNLLNTISIYISEIMSTVLYGIYEGPFGVDMMIIANPKGGYSLHPCVELNLRRTMGHVALSLSPNEGNPRKIMNIFIDGRYSLHIRNSGDDLVNTSIYY